jgi:hypothetical protein
LPAKDLGSHLQSKQAAAKVAGSHDSPNVLIQCAGACAHVLAGNEVLG